MKKDRLKQLKKQAPYRTNILSFYHFNNLHLTLAFATNKDKAPMLKQLATLKPATIACTTFTNNKFRTSANPNELAEKLKKLLPKSKIVPFSSPQKAWQWSLKQTQKDDILLVTGSFFLAGQIKAIIDKDGFSL